MNSKSMRRLAGDLGSLHTAGLPPNYLFPPSNSSDPHSDLTSLDVLLAGPTGTPYANGVWRLHLDIPPTYPAAPPTATFRTRLWHPNIDEATGAVCVETLKRDWSSTLKLRDVLVTISCLLIQPNPASALNEAAGKLASEDWDGFCRRAKLMTEIHAGIPAELRNEVKEAQSRGEDPEPKEAKVDAQSETTAKGKEKADMAATPVSKTQRSLVAEDEENRKRRGDTAEPDSDPESDWIPGPGKLARTLTAERDNIFGIKGLDDSMQLDTPPEKVIWPPSNTASQQDPTNEEETDPFTTVLSKRDTHSSFSLRIPPASSSNNPAEDPTDPLKFATHNKFAAIQQSEDDDDRANRLLKEFSWTWQDAAVLNGTATFKDGPTKSQVQKRLASEEFEKKQKWELKKFKQAGCDIKRYNRGDWGPRTGIFRL